METRNRTQEEILTEKFWFFRPTNAIEHSTQIVLITDGTENHCERFNKQK